MTQRSVTHHTFTIERAFPAKPARVFAAVSQLDSIKKWFAGPPEWGEERIELDFRVGGTMTASGGPKGGVQHRFACRYFEIIPNERIIYAYEMHLDDTRISVSLATIEIAASGTGTRLVITEAGSFLDGTDTGGARERGTQDLIDKLGQSLQA